MNKFMYYLPEVIIVTLIALFLLLVSLGCKQPNSCNKCSDCCCSDDCKNGCKEEKCPPNVEADMKSDIIRKHTGYVSSLVSNPSRTEIYIRFRGEVRSHCIVDANDSDFHSTIQVDGVVKTIDEFMNWYASAKGPVRVTISVEASSAKTKVISSFSKE